MVESKQLDFNKIQVQGYLTGYLYRKVGYCKISRGRRAGLLVSACIFPLFKFLVTACKWNDAALSDVTVP